MHQERCSDRTYLSIGVTRHGPVASDSPYQMDIILVYIHCLAHSAQLELCTAGVELFFLLFTHHGTQRWDMFVNTFNSVPTWRSLPCAER